MDRILKTFYFRNKYDTEYFIYSGEIRLNFNLVGDVVYTKERAYIGYTIQINNF